MVRIWEGNAAALERVPGTRPTSSRCQVFQASLPKFISGRQLDPEDHSGVPGFSLKDVLGSNHDITWPGAILFPWLSTSFASRNVVDASLKEKPVVTNYNNGKLFTEQLHSSSTLWFS